MGLFNKMFHRTIEDFNSYFCELRDDYSYRKLAIEICIDLIANAMSSVEYRTYKENKRERSDLYYRLNVTPNGKQNSSEFYKKLVHRLYFDNEVLIVSPSSNEDELFIADSFNEDKKALKPSIFSNVFVDDFELNRTFKEDDCLYLKLSDINIRRLVSQYYESYGKLLVSSMNFYKRNNAKRMVLKGDLLHGQQNDKQKQINDLMTGQFKPWFEADNAGAVFQLQNGFELEDYSSNQIKPDSRDVKNLLDDIFDVTASAFHVPNGIFKGDLSGLSDQIDSFLIFTVRPLVNLIVDEVNTKLFKREEILKGTQVKADTANIKISDLSTLANSIDKLISSGAMSVNDASERVGTDYIDEDWANKRYITKNYAEAKEMVENNPQNQISKGGENNEEGKFTRI